VPYLIRIAETQTYERAFHLLTGFGTCFVRGRRYIQCTRRSTKKLKFIEDLFKRYVSKQNTQLEASKKDMFDKMGVQGG
jgi:hypothetical protein